MKAGSFNSRSLRVRLCLWYVFLSMFSMAVLGVFSYVYLSHALESSRQQTMERREVRLMRYIQSEPRTMTLDELPDSLHHFMQANGDTDILEAQDLAGNSIFPDASSPPSILWFSTDGAGPQFKILDRNGHRYRTLQQVVSLHGRPVRLTMAGMVDEHYDILRMVETSYLIFLPLMFIVSIAGGFVLSHRALEPVDRITRAAHSISIRDLSHRLPVPQTGDELQRLAETWNELMERLESAVNSLRQFTGDLSHDLRTSITVMLSTSQLALRRERSSREYRESLETIAAECQSTTNLLDDLLAASQSDLARERMHRSVFDLSDLVLEICEHAQARAEIKKQDLVTQLHPDCFIAGDSSLIRRLVNIFLDNALKYTGERGKICVLVDARDGNIFFEIRDTGVGIPPAEVAQIFNRFYRGDASRNREHGGNGLGLAIAKWIADAHGSEIRVEPNSPVGSIFSVAFQQVGYPISA